MKINFEVKNYVIDRILDILGMDKIDTTEEQLISEIKRLKEISTCRKPVAAVIGPQSSTWQEMLVVVCDDGTVWIENGGWKSTTPIPGTRADLDSLDRYNKKEI